jgi:hypothetical protein
MSKKPQRKKEKIDPRLTPGLKLHVVQRRSWREGWDYFHREEDDGGCPVRAFVDRAKAETLRDELEQQARRQVPLFRFIFGTPLILIEDEGKSAFCDKLMALGVPPPPPKTLAEDLEEESWKAWWDQISGDLTDAQREGLWDLLFPEDECFYDIVETELDNDS